MSFSGKHMVVFGGTGGIGSALVALLVAAGAEVSIIGRSQEKLEKLKAEFAVNTYGFDASDIAAVKAWFKEQPAIDGVANLIGSMLIKPAHLTSAEDWHKVLNTNLTTSFAIVRAAGKFMRQGGSVVLTSTAAARQGLANHEAIAAAKAGVEGLARSAAATYANMDLRFNVVAPGLVETPLTAAITGNAMAAKTSLAMHALGRFGQPDDVARMVFWLLNPENSWISGQVFGVDGGLSRIMPRMR